MDMPAVLRFITVTVTEHAGTMKDAKQEDFEHQPI